MSVLEDTSTQLASHDDLIDIDDFTAKYGRTKEILDSHNDHIADTSQMSSEYFASVHTPVDNWRKIEGARKALHDEREKLEKKHSWNLSKPRYRSETEDEARKLGVDYHYGKLLLLCHIKGSQLSVSRQTYKGRIVYCGNNTLDQDGDQAVFSAQGTGSSHLSAAKFVDAIARLPGNDGED